jgi:hypothetical protein
MRCALDGIPISELRTIEIQDVLTSNLAETKCSRCGTKHYLKVGFAEGNVEISIDEQERA